MSKELIDIVITCSSVETDDVGNIYAITKVFRIDYEGTAEDFIEQLTDKSIVHFEQLVAKS